MSLLINVNYYRWERGAASCNVGAYVFTRITDHDLISEIKLGVNRQDQTVTNRTGSFITQWQIPSLSVPDSQCVLESCTDWNIKVLCCAGVEIFQLPLRKTAVSVNWGKSKKNHNRFHGFWHLLGVILYLEICILCKSTKDFALHIWTLDWSHWKVIVKMCTLHIQHKTFAEACVDILYFKF